MKKIFKKILIFLFLAFFCISYCYLTDKKDSCLDTGICPEGIEINTEYGKLIINEQNCIKYHWKWNKNKQWCDFRK